MTFIHLTPLVPVLTSQDAINAGVSVMAHNTDASTSTCIDTKSHIIHLNNHLSMTNAMVSLRAPSASCDR